MTDPQRTDRPPLAGDLPERERDARVEELLLTGLDHYFAGQYELAISVWTRVLFLNHGHARARAYIDRARSALAERQREGEELLHTGVEAFKRGDGDRARQLLKSAVERGAARDEAQALLDRLDRLETAATDPQSASAEPARQRARAGDAASFADEGRRARLPWIAAGIVAGAAIAGAAAWVWVSRADWLPADRSGPSAALRHYDEPLPVPAASEAWLARARALHSTGRLHDALTSLDAIHQGDALRAEADQLRAIIQGELLAAGERAPAPVPTQGSQRTASRR